MKILAIDIGGTAIKVAETLADGTVLTTREYESEGKKGGPYVIDKVSEIIKGYNGYNRIGISTAGQVDVKNGSIFYANENIPFYTGMKVKTILEERFKVPVAVENDVNAAALGEAFYGAGKEYKDFLCLTYGTGVGGAIIINKEIYGGNKGVAGEFGHILTHPNGRSCGCKQKGCYEQYASTTALIKAAKEVDSTCESGRIIFEKIAEGQTDLVAVVDAWVDEIVLGLVTLTHIFNPECFILGGGVMEQPAILKKIEERFYTRVMPSYREVVLKKAALGNKAGVLGATYLVARH